MSAQEMQTIIAMTEQARVMGEQAASRIIALGVTSAETREFFTNSYTDMKNVHAMLAGFMELHQQNKLTFGAWYDIFVTNNMNAVTPGIKEIWEALPKYELSVWEEYFNQHVLPEVGGLGEQVRHIGLMTGLFAMFRDLPDGESLQKHGTEYVQNNPL